MVKDNILLQAAIFLLLLENAPSIVENSIINGGTV